MEPPPHASPLVLRHRRVCLNQKARKCRVDDTEYSVCLGNWMFYIPVTQEKFFHARAGVTDCIHPTRPPDEKLQKEWADKTYTSADWRRALSKPLERRLAELWVATDRLARAGLGPRCLGVTFADEFVRDGLALGPTMGLITEDVERLPAKRPCVDEDMVAAGVRPDRIRSSVRQQVRGYVIDLNSVVGVQPIDAEEEILRVLAWIGHRAKREG